MRIMFWNTNRKNNINRYIVNVVHDYNIDILVTAEYICDKEELEELMIENHLSLVECNTAGCKRINIWSNYVDIESAVQTEYYSIQIIQKKYILCCVHMFTDMYGNSDDERLEVARQMVIDIADVEKSITSKRTIIIGDFNAMPYDKSCLNANGLHGLPVLNINDSPTRMVKGKVYRKFYNPMWSLMGDFSYPPGTYYYNNSSLYAPMWYMFDQVLISKEVLKYFNKESLKIITSCSYGDLMDKKGRPNKNISDHFPIMCEINE